jgi:hypothetical protein
MLTPLFYYKHNRRTTQAEGSLMAVRLGERLWRDGFRYSKCGVMITELLPETIGNRRYGAR